MPEFRLTQEDAREYWLEISEIEVPDRGPDKLTFQLSDCEAVALFEAVDAGIGDYVREMRREKAAFDRARWVDPPEPGEGYELDDPKHPSFHDNMTGFYDHREGK